MLPSLLRTSKDFYFLLVSQSLSYIPWYLVSDATIPSITIFSMINICHITNWKSRDWRHLLRYEATYHQFLRLDECRHQIPRASCLYQPEMIYDDDDDIWMVNEDEDDDGDEDEDGDENVERYIISHQYSSRYSCIYNYQLHC